MKSPATSTHPASLRIQAEKALKEGDPGKAEMLIMQSLSHDASDAAAIALLGDVCWVRKNLQLAVGYYTLAIKANPSDISAKRRFVVAVSNMTFTKPDKNLEETILECLKTPELPNESLRTPWLTLLLLDAPFQELYSSVLAEDSFAKISDLTPLLRPYFLWGLQKMVIINIEFERFLTRLRSFLLDSPVPPPLTAALAQQCFTTDYIFDITDNERKKVDGLREKIEAGAIRDALVYACYAPLWTLRNASAVRAALHESEDGVPVAVTQIDNYLSLQKTATEIVAITAIDDATSIKVKEQYEVFPYPQWQGIVPQEMIAKPKKESDALDKKGARVLIAGCGTGKQPIYMAAAYPRANILAVDLSRASLSYAINKAREYKISNITFRQADILKLGELPQKFDYIACSGVLHHMQDPIAGWKVLTGLLKPGGMMFISLYSKIARQCVSAARAAIEKSGYPATIEGIRAFRREAERLMNPQDLAVLRLYIDYYQAPTCCDLLFHAREYQFNIPEIESSLKELGLVFGGFNLPATAAEDYTAALSQGEKPWTLADWHVYEQKHPLTFIEMYHFWCSNHG